MQFLKNTKYKKIRTKNFKNTKYKQKNTNPKFQKYKIQKIQIQQWAREPTPCSFWKARTNLWNKCKANLLYFLNPAIQILYFWVLFFFGSVQNGWNNLIVYWKMVRSCSFALKNGNFFPILLPRLERSFPTAFHFLFSLPCPHLARWEKRGDVTGGRQGWNSLFEGEAWQRH